MGVREEVYGPVSIKETFLLTRTGLSGLDWLLASNILNSRV